MKQEISKCCWVSVQDPGLLMLQQFAPKGAPPNNIGIVTNVRKDGNLDIEFPIGDDDMSKHSQASMYPKSICYITAPPKNHKDYQP